VPPELAVLNVPEPLADPDALIEPEPEMFGELVVPAAFEFWPEVLLLLLKAPDCVVLPVPALDCPLVPVMDEDEELGNVDWLVPDCVDCVPVEGVCAAPLAPLVPLVPP